MFEIRKNEYGLYYIYDKRKNDIYSISSQFIISDNYNKLKEFIKDNRKDLINHTLKKVLKSKYFN